MREPQIESQILWTTLFISVFVIALNKEECYTNISLLPRHAYVYRGERYSHEHCVSCWKWF